MDNVFVSAGPPGFVPVEGVGEGVGEGEGDGEGDGDGDGDGEEVPGKC